MFPFQSFVRYFGKAQIDEAVPHLSSPRDSIYLPMVANVTRLMEGSLIIPVITDKILDWRSGKLLLATQKAETDA